MIIFNIFDQCSFLKFIGLHGLLFAYILFFPVHILLIFVDGMFLCMLLAIILFCILLYNLLLDMHTLLFMIVVSLFTL